MNCPCSTARYGFFSFSWPLDAPRGSVTLDDAGYIWLGVAEHTADREAAGGGWRYRLLSPEGEFLGETRLPPITRPSICQGNLLGMLTEPETGEIHLIVYRIVPAVSGLTYP